MGKVNTNSMKNWKDGDIIDAATYKFERDSIVTSVNVNDTRLGDAESAIVKKAESADVYTKANLDGGQLDNRYYIKDHFDQGGLDWRYYTEAEIASLLQDNVNGNHAGTWQGLNPGQVAEAVNGGRLDVIEPMLDTSVPSATASASRGLNTVVADAASQLNVIAQGRTLTNLLGRYARVGSGTIVSGAASDTDVALETEITVNTVNTSEGGIVYSQKGGTILNASAGKYYLLCGEMNITSVSGSGQIGIAGSSGVGIVTADKTKLGVWQRLYKPFTFVSSTDYNVLIGNYYAGGVHVSSTFIIRNIQVLEISQAEYWDFSNLTQAQKESLYPHVSDMKSVNGLYVRKPGKNLLPPMDDMTAWELTSQHVVTSPYSLSINTSTTGLQAKCTVSVIGGQTYTLTCGSMTGPNVRIIGQWLDNSLTVISTTSPFIQGGLLTATAPSNAAYFKIYLDSSTGAAGSYTYSNIQMELGTSATAFEPFRQEYMYVPVPLHGMNGAYDTLDTRTNRVLRRFKELTLDGSLEWSASEAKVGYKNVLFPHGYAVTQLVQAVIKYDGKVATLNTGTFTGGDQYSHMWGGSGFYMSIANADSGWGDSYVPSSAEVQAYFNGYKMITLGNQVGTGSYNGSGTKAWVGIDYATANPTSTNVTTIDLYYALASKAPITPYRMIYQLTAPVWESAGIEGGLSLHAGPNQYELGEGAVVREKVQFNASKQATTPKQCAKVLAVYKNGQPEDFTTYTSGSQTLPQLINPVDVTAEYSVTYIALQKYALTSAVSSATLDFAPSLAMASVRNIQMMSSMLQNLNAVQNTVSNVRSMLAGKTITDLNNAVEVGVYNWNPSTLNRPEDVSGYGICVTSVSLGSAYNGSSNWCFQIAYQTAYAAIWTRRKINAGNWSGWSRVWTSENDGSGSGLDADTVRGYVPVNKAGDTMSGNLSIQGGSSDPSIYLNDTDAPATSYRVKQIMSSKNVGGGNDWLLRQIRPIDGAVQDYLLSTSNGSGASGQIWHTGMLRNNAGALELYYGGSWTPVGGVKSVQRGVSGAGDVTISAVNMNKSFVIATVRTGYVGTSNAPATAMATAQLTSSTNLHIQCDGTFSSVTVEWQVVESY